MVASISHVSEHLFGIRLSFRIRPAVDFDEEDSLARFESPLGTAQYAKFGPLDVHLDEARGRLREEGVKLSISGRILMIFRNYQKKYRG